MEDINLKRPFIIIQLEFLQFFTYLNNILTIRKVREKNDNKNAEKNNFESEF